MKYEEPPYGYALSRYTLRIGQATNDADKFGSGVVSIIVNANKFDSDKGPAQVVMSSMGPGFDTRSSLTPATARRIAAALIEAAGICEQFDGQQKATA